MKQYISSRHIPDAGVLKMVDGDGPMIKFKWKNSNE